MAGTQQAVQHVDQILLRHPLAIKLECLAGGDGGALVSDTIAVLQRPSADRSMDDFEIVGIEFKVGLFRHDDNEPLA